MEFIDVIKARSSVREYSDRPVDAETISAVLECARLAPSWANKQCWRFIVITNKETIEHIAKSSIINRWLKTAPVLIVACADPAESGSHNSCQGGCVCLLGSAAHIGFILPGPGKHGRMILVGFDVLRHTIGVVVKFPAVYWCRCPMFSGNFIVTSRRSYS